MALILFIGSFLVLPTAKMVNNVYYALIALPAIIVLIAMRGRGIRATPETLLWGALLAWSGVAGALSGDVGFIKHISYVALFLLITGLIASPAIFRKEHFARGLFWVVLWYVLGSGLYYWMSGRYAVGERVLWLPSRMDGPIFTSMWLASCFALALPFWLKERRWPELILAFMLTLLCAGYILQSRSGLVGLLAVSLMTCFYHGFTNRLRVSSLVIVGGCIGLAGWFSFEHVPQVNQLFARGDAFRFELWAALVREWQACGWWLGCGVNHQSSYVLASGGDILHPHSIYVALGIYTGLVSLLIFLMLMVATLRRAWEFHDPWGLYLAAALVSLAFDGSKLIGNPDERWLLVLLPAGLIMNRKPDKRLGHA